MVGAVGWARLSQGGEGRGADSLPTEPRLISTDQQGSTCSRVVWRSCMNLVILDWAMKLHRAAPHLGLADPQVAGTQLPTTLVG